MNRILLNIIVLTFCINLSFAQTVQEDFEKIAKLYEKRSYSYNISYAYYNDISSNNASEVLNGFVKLNGNNFHYKIGDNEVFRNTKYIVVLDRSSKTLMLDTVFQQERYTNTKIDMTELLKVYEGVTKEQKNGYTQYKLNDPQAGVAYMTIDVNDSIGYIQGIGMYFLENRKGKDPKSLRNKLIITCSNVKMETNYPAIYFNENKYFTRENKKIQISPTFKNYDLINHLN